MKVITGWTISILFGALGLSIPTSEAKEEVATQASAPAAMISVRQIEGPQLSAAQTILLSSYSFGERGERVKTLQKTISTVRVDGHYGAITRREHIERLQEMGLPILTVPQIPDTLTNKQNSSGWNIPSDKDKRCPMWEQLFEDVGLEPVEVFSYVAWRESHCNPAAQNAKWDKNGNMTYALNKDKSYDTGLLQINSSWRSRVAEVCGEDAIENRMSGLKDIHCNVKFAKWIMDNSEGKLGNWRVYKN